LPIASSVFSVLSCTYYKVSGLILRFLIHVELLLEQDRHGSSFSFLQADNHFSQQHFLKRLFSPSYVFGNFIKKKGGHSCVDSYLGPIFSSTGLHICFCASTMLVYIAMALSYSLKSGIVIPPALLILGSIALVIHTLVFPNEL
jgi:hypothetical protein